VLIAGDAWVTDRCHDDGVALATERSGVLVLRIWTESGLVDDLRARISSSIDLDSAPPHTAVAGSLDEIRAIVAGFLEAFLDASA
jgi:hypothetical protein